MCVCGSNLTARRTIMVITMALLSSRRSLVAAFLSPKGRCAQSLGSFEYSKSQFYPINRVISSTSSAIRSSTTTTAGTDNNSSSFSNEDATPAVVIPRKFKPFPFQYHEVLTLKVESLSNRGIGVCRAPIPKLAIPVDLDDDHGEDEDDEQKEQFEKDHQSNNKGWVVFVPNVIPGETIKCRIYRNFGSYSDADLLEILDPSPNRVEGPCPLKDQCGGCQYQHIHIQTQREWKTSQVQELLERIGRQDPDTFPATLPTVGTDEIYHYRSKITPHYDRPVKNDSGIGDLKIRSIGFKMKANRNLIDVPYCHIATKRINEKLAEYREVRER